MHGKPSLHSIKASLGYFAIISPIPPASFTVAAALLIATLKNTEAKQSTTFPATNVELSKRAWHALQGNS